MKNSETNGKKSLSDRLGILRPAGPFLLAVLISTLIWLVNSLNKTHTAVVEIPIRYPLAVSAPSRGFTQAINAEISGRGFDLIRFLLNDEARILTVQADTGRISSSEATSRHLLAGNASLKVNRVTPAWIDPPHNHFYSRKLRVVPAATFSTAPSYVKTTGAVSVPDSVLVYSEKPIPENINSISTETIRHKALTRPWFGSAKIILPENLNLQTETEKVWIYQPVEEATEITLTLPVNPGTGIPYNFRFIPATVTLTCIVPVSRYSITTAEKFLLSASVSTADQSRAVVQLIKAPDWAMNVRYTPAAVDFLKVNP